MNIIAAASIIPESTCPTTWSLLITATAYWSSVVIFSRVQIARDIPHSTAKRQLKVRGRTGSYNAELHFFVGSYYFSVIPRGSGFIQPYAKCQAYLELFF